MAEIEIPERKFAVGVQEFDWIRERKSQYIDKTAYVYKMVSTDAKYFFLSRPRRFGKSLLVDTLRCYFEGLTDKNQNEQLYQSLIYAALMGFGADVQAEDQTSDGRMDIALKMPDAIYIMELKYGKTAEEATDQILQKDYAVRFAADTRPVYAIGLSISQDRRTIESYEIVRVNNM